MTTPNHASSPRVADKATEQPFRVHARLIAEIGDELISADEIALYELIKNAFDAGSPWVRVDVSTPVAAAEVESVISTLEDGWDFEVLKASPLLPLLEGDDVYSRARRAVRQRDEASLRDLLLEALKQRSEIVVEDRGSGMDRSTLEEGFLSLATPLRLRQAGSGPGGRPVLGSKGLGRFSAKRLGRKLRVETATSNGDELNVLEIDWTQYDAKGEAFLDEIENDLWSEPLANGFSGTRLVITELNEVWTPDLLRSLARSRIAQLMNPFFPNDFRIHLRLNGDPIDLANFQKSVLSRARLHVFGRLDPAKTPPLKLAITYLGKKQRPRIPLSERQLAPIHQLEGVGPFEFELWEFDRRDRAMGMIGKRTVIADFIDTWGGGGPMLFRDGFRVFPYGNKPDDWLDLEGQFFSGRSGSRLRTPAVVGYVAISSSKNPRLVDQTNREGLRMTPAGKAFVGAMRDIVGIINDEYRYLTPSTKNDDRAKLSIWRRTMEESLAESSDHVSEARTAVEGNAEATAVIDRLAGSIESMNTATRAFLALGDKLGGTVSASSYQSLLELAGLGMTAEHLAHELSSLIDRSLGLLDQVGGSKLSTEIQLRLGQLRSNLESIRGVVTYLTPLTQASRRRRVKLDVAEELQTIAGHYPALSGDGVRYELDVRSPLVVRMSRGVLLQVFDNLITNSLYWLHESRTPRPSIRTVVDGIDNEVSVTDNGPGIDPRVGDLVFEPFMSTRRGGRGLGLFIARELLELEDGKLELGSPDHDGRIRTFLIDLSGRAQRDAG
ncbi:MAG TPA: ATP-binding protein [Candidatus Limnocylindrales bacterium]|jgi:signal transduction histidine kinase|nr:ATP-binding protein [Candidatus Limnocylindrales bacterium]